MYSRINKTSDQFTASADKYPQGYFKLKPCRWCGDQFQPIAPSHLFCGDECSHMAQQEKYLKRTYGITYKTYIEMQKEQNSLCKICNGVGFKMKPGQSIMLVVDHCHTTGKVRGLLCHNCNRALGLLKDSVANLNSAIIYLQGATTIPEGSTAKWLEAHGPSNEGDDIV